MPGAGKPVTTADGLAFAHWRTERARSSPQTIVIEFFGRVPRGARDSPAVEAADIGRFLAAPLRVRIQG